MTERISRLAGLIRSTGTPRHLTAREAGRNRLTRSIDTLMLWVRTYVPPLHWLFTILLGSSLFLYARIVARTAELIPLGVRQWPDVPSRAVLAIWHGSTPCLLAAIAKRTPRSNLVILITTEPRGDILTILCRLLGLDVIRGDWEHHGLHAMKKVAERVSDGACAIITPDGGGPRQVARAGAVVLAAAGGVPLFPVGTDCHPGITQPRKWDRSRNPLPFSRIAVAMDEPVVLGGLDDPSELECARLRLEQALNHAQTIARDALDVRTSPGKPF